MTCIAPRRLVAEPGSAASVPEHHGSIPSTRPSVSWHTENSYIAAELPTLIIS